ncbi:MAG: metallopeptidase [Pseudonocardiales bacterium]|nr:metallopeptidase [Pseudonocardiales bacterium]
MTTPRVRSYLFAVTLGIAALLAPAGIANATPEDERSGAQPGAPGVGDPYFPDSGNGGFHVVHYDIDLDYNPKTGYLKGAATISAVATQSLSSFDLDLLGLNVASVTVDAATVPFTRSGQELVIVPRRAIRSGQNFEVEVRYAGVPDPVIDPDGTSEGWMRTDDGSVFVANEPQGAMSWFPGNSHPIDKSAFDITVRVPTGFTAVGNGELVSQRSAGGATTFHWRESEPMAAYLATASIGRFQVSTYKIGRLPVYVAVDPREAAGSAASLAKLPTILAWETGLFGAYPFSSTGAIVMHAPDVGYAFETQTRPLFDQAVDDSTLVHELAHQWFGDSVSITRWQDIWLTESFATYAEWLWSEKSGGESTQQLFDDIYARPADDDVWARPTADPGSGEFIFDSPVYERGAMVLHKLRQRVGDVAFFAILKVWTMQHAYGYGTTAQFTALATRLSHQDLSRLFQTWLYTAGKPGSS